jgi:hypothetical protein
MTKDQQDDYIDKHPNSKFAKQKYSGRVAKPKDSSNNKDKDKDKDKDTKDKQQKLPSMFSVFKEPISKLSKNYQDFFKNKQDKPNSDERKSLAKHLRTSKTDLMDGLKHQVHEWKDGCKAIKKIATGKQISDHEKKAVKTLVIDAAITAASVAITGGFAHGLAAAIKHTAFDVLKDVVLKTTIRSTAYAMGASTGVTGGILGIDVLHSLASSDTNKLRDISNDEVLSHLTDSLIKFIESGNIPKEAWEKAIADLKKHEDITKNK